MSRGGGWGFRRAARIGLLGWGRQASNHQLRARARAAGSEPRLQLPGPEPEPPRALASRADHERSLLPQQPQHRARGAEPLSPSPRPRRRALRGEVSLHRALRLPRGCCSSRGARRPSAWRSDWEVVLEKVGLQGKQSWRPSPTPSRTGVWGPEWLKWRPDLCPRGPPNWLRFPRPGSRREAPSDLGRASLLFAPDWHLPGCCPLLNPCGSRLLVRPPIPVPSLSAPRLEGGQETRAPRGSAGSPRLGGGEFLH